MITRMFFRAGSPGLVGDDSGQDLIEYALLVAALAVIVAGCLPAEVIPVISTIFSKITSSMNAS